MAFLPGRTNAAPMATNLTLLEQGLPPNLEEIELYGPRKVRVGGRSSTTRVRARRKGGDSGPSPLGGVNELFWQGPRGVNLDEGHPVPQGYMSGHRDHVHVGADSPQAALQAGRIAQRMGLTVRENPAFGDAVDPVHSSTSFHYRTVNHNRRKVGLGLDVSGPTNVMARYATRIARRAVRARRRS